MKRFKIEISEEEVRDGNDKKFFNHRSREQVVFQILLPEGEVDIKGVLQKIVAGPSLDKVKSLLQ
jgi:hypothetical protein